MRKGIKDGQTDEAMRRMHELDIKRGLHLHHRLPRRDRGVDVRDHLPGRAT